MTFTSTITKRVRKRVLTDGAMVKQTRYVLNFIDPTTAKRRQLFFGSQSDAVAKRDELIVATATGQRLQLDAQSKLTVAEAVEYWLANRRTEVKANTLRGYELLSRHHVVGPLGHFRVAELTTAQIRRWHQDLQARVSPYTANVAKKHLGASLALAAEDFNLRPAPMPTRLGRGRPKPKKTILTTAEVARLLDHAKRDPYGIQYAFPFLTGVRPSEQLGLQWHNVDFEKGVIRIAAILERDGSVCEVTKTAAGLRDVPMGPLLRSMLLEWRAVCPSNRFVFPGPQGGPFRYWNFRRRVWSKGIAAAGLRHVTPHSARHAFIATLQAQGFEVALVAKLAGHTPAVSVSHYTQAVRNGDAAMLALEQAYSA